MWMLDGPRAVSSVRAALCVFRPSGGMILCALPMCCFACAGNAQAGAVIGKGGEGIKMIRAKAGATVKVSAAAEMPPGVRLAALSPLSPARCPRCEVQHPLRSCLFASTAHQVFWLCVGCFVCVLRCVPALDSSVSVVCAYPCACVCVLQSVDRLAVVTGTHDGVLVAMQYVCASLSTSAPSPAPASAPTYGGGGGGYGAPAPGAGAKVLAVFSLRCDCTGCAQLLAWD